MNIPRDKADDAGRKQKTTEPAKHPFYDFPEHIVLGRGDLVLAVGMYPTMGLRGIKSTLRRHIESLESLLGRDLVPVKGGKVYARSTYQTPPKLVR